MSPWREGQWCLCVDGFLSQRVSSVFEVMSGNGTVWPARGSMDLLAPTLGSLYIELRWFFVLSVYLG